MYLSSLLILPVSKISLWMKWRYWQDFVKLYLSLNIIWSSIAILHCQHLSSVWSVNQKNLTGGTEISMDKNGKLLNSRLPFIVYCICLCFNFWVTEIWQNDFVDWTHGIKYYQKKTGWCILPTYGSCLYILFSFYNDRKWLNVYRLTDWIWKQVLQLRFYSHS